jgi:V8-like Glu-specific endopeptidase
MSNRLLLLFVPWLFVSCAGKSYIPSDTIPPTDPLDTSYVISLLLPIGNAGHACPCDGKVYTARHVAISKNPNGELYYTRFTWQDRRGNEGLAVTTLHNEFKDLAVIQPINSQIEYYYPKAATRPEEGDEIYWVGFDPNSFKDVRRSSKVAFYFAKYVFFKDLPYPGSSGSCLFNSDGEVIGVVVWGVMRGKTLYGVGVLVTDEE